MAPGHRVQRGSTLFSKRLSKVPKGNVVPIHKKKPTLETRTVTSVRETEISTNRFCRHSSIRMTFTYLPVNIQEISGNLRISQEISGYLRISQEISGNLGKSQKIGGEEATRLAPRSKRLMLVTAPNEDLTIS